MNSKQRAYLMSLAQTLDSQFQMGKERLTPEFTAAVDEALQARELIKIHVLNNCIEDPKEVAHVLAERTHAQVVQVIGRRIVLYREAAPDRKKIYLPGQKKPEKR